MSYHVFAHLCRVSSLDTGFSLDGGHGKLCMEYCVDEVGERLGFQLGSVDSGKQQILGDKEGTEVLGRAGD